MHNKTHTSTAVNELTDSVLDGVTGGMFGIGPIGPIYVPLPTKGGGGGNGGGGGTGPSDGGSSPDHRSANFDPCTVHFPA